VEVKFYPGKKQEIFDKVTIQHIGTFEDSMNVIDLRNMSVTVETSAVDVEAEQTPKILTLKVMSRFSIVAQHSNSECGRA
jgi:hypothetical protein